MPSHLDILCRDCFISNDDAQTLKSFVRAASKIHPNLQHAKISDSLWSLYTLKLSKEFSRSGTYAQKTLVSCVGKQPRSTNWVLSPDVQINCDGHLIPPAEQKFFWWVQSNLLATCAVKLTMNEIISVLYFTGIQSTFVL